MRYSSHMTEKDRDIPFKERWRVIPSGIESPTLSDVRKRYFVISGALLGLVITVSSLAEAPHNPEPKQPVAPTQTFFSDNYQHCIANALDELATDPAAAQIQVRDCRAKYDPLATTTSTSTTSPQS